MESNKELFFKDILDRHLKERDIDDLINDLLREIESIEAFEKDNNYLDLLFLLYLDEISQKLYCKSEDEEVLPLVEKEKYSNNKGTGYFDLLFKAASILIFQLLNKHNWNVILKMDVHNCPLGPSLFSLVSWGDSKPHFSFKKNNYSKAYSLFFMYNLFCKDRVKNKEIKKEEVYTVHKEFSDRKAIRSISYQYNKDGDFVRYYDGDDEELFAKSKREGEKLYLDFLSCVLDESFITKETLFANYFKKKMIGNNSLYRKPWQTAKSFSFFNLGVSGFESWGTLMIEALASNNQDKCICTAREVNDCFYHKVTGDEEREDGRELGKIKSIISALRKVDDEYNDALNKQKIKNESIKSAKAAIMSRNMSHNIGSHVMSYLKQHLSSVTNIINDNVLAEMITSASDTTLIPSDKPLPFLVGMGHFLSYLQERQDFIATIATDYIPYFSTVNFKDFVYDELNPDKRFERHKDRKNLQPDNIMLGNIARSEGLGRKIQTTSRRTGLLSDIVLNFRDAEGHIFDGEPVVNSSNGIISGRNDASKALEAMRKLEVSLPGGVIGRQAIFSIVENIIRNAAKHGNWRRQGKLELTFDFVDKDAIEEYGQLIRRKIELEGLKREGTLTESEQSEYDSIINELEKKNSDAAPIETPSYLWPWRKKHLSLMEVLWLFYSQSLDADELYFVSITDNIVISDSAVNKLREAILEPYIDNDSKMKEANKGIKEIRISAAWLRGAKNEEEYFTDPTDDKNPQTEKKAPLVYVRQHNGCLQYIFCLQKPRNVAVVTQDPLSTTAIKALKEVNWRYYSPEEYMKERNKSYVFTICENQDVFNIIRPFSSSRVYIPDSKNLWNSIKNGLSESDSKVYEKELYQSLVKEKSTIWIDDDKAKGGMTTYIREDADYATQEDAGYYKVNDVDVCVIDGCQSHVDYIYRKHHDTLEQFTTFMGVNPNGCQFVESITGDTSTDRLVRNEKYDFRWYYSHLHAMQKKVAIFDERLFSRIYGLEEADFTKGSVEDLDELKTRYCEIKPLSRRRINDCKTFDDLKRIVSDMNLPSIEVSRSDVYTKDYIALTYYQKGVCFYTLIKDTVEDPLTRSFGVYGLYYEGENSIMPQCDEKYSCRCERIATIAWQNQTLKVEFEKSSKKQTENQFDFISIHQGLLDKLYEAFDLKSNQEEKIQFTTTLCRRFSKISSDNSRDWKSGFIPGLVIHSGRSKPAENDMPQMLPFIQYASIEHAVLDCKYSLVDLLENARYER